MSLVSDVFDVLCSDAQKKSAATPAAEYKKTDEAQPDVKEEEAEEEEAAGGPEGRRAGRPSDLPLVT